MKSQSFLVIMRTSLSSSINVAMDWEVAAAVTLSFSLACSQNSFPGRAAKQRTHNISTKARMLLICCRGRRAATKNKHWSFSF